jgi:hypothetical protein
MGGGTDFFSRAIFGGRATQEQARRGFPTDFAVVEHIETVDGCRAGRGFPTDFAVVEQSLRKLLLQTRRGFPTDFAVVEP